eukprot:TRINITY_DN32247_c0_g1_i1.p1 TRINITY_DN32247_c0_g1~~TRINITY_DN32247_c0_g1_i1.p1  ORF type:complete len:266 (-),score=47.86 TRINITY_DN32247_c0_g1_i1:226-1023(-)
MELTTGLIFAVKQTDTGRYVGQHNTQHDKLNNELQILQSLAHPNIVKLLGYHVCDSALSVFMEYVPRGSVTDFLREFGPLEEPLLGSATMDTLRGSEYLHSHSPVLIHRDVKGANILVDASFNMKLTDFGSSKISDLSTTFSTAGSIPWMAPEVMLQQNGNGRKADIWSLGCTILEMATADLPWGKNAFQNPMLMLQRIACSDSRPEMPSTLPDALEAVTLLCLQRQVDWRPSASKLLCHPYFLAFRAPTSDWLPRRSKLSLDSA